MRYVISAALAALLILAGCDSTGPDFSTYTLAQVNGNPLPFPDPGSPALEVVAGGFELYSRGNTQEWLQVRCRAVLPPNTECHIEGDGITRRGMIFNALENRVYLGDGTWFPMRVEADSATIQYGSSYEWHFGYERER